METVARKSLTVGYAENSLRGIYVLEFFMSLIPLEIYSVYLKTAKIRVRSARMEMELYVDGYSAILYQLI